MAYFQYISEITNDCLISSFQHLLEEVGLTISQEFSTHAQIFAEDSYVQPDYKSKVNVLISWTDKSKKECSVEVRSDEPFLKREISCEKVFAQLR